jgi:hypothetical protein
MFSLAKVIGTLVVVWWISNVSHIQFLYVAIAIAVIYGIFKLSQHMGWLGLSPSARTHRSSGDFTDTAKRFAVFTGVMMVATFVISVSNHMAFDAFVDLGWRPWLWPSGVSLDLLLWVCVAFGAAWTVSKEPQFKAAGMIFAIAAFAIFGWQHLHGTVVGAVPTEKVAGKATPTWHATDTAVHDNGVVSVVTTGAAAVVVGHRADVEEDGVIGSSLKRAWKFAFGKHSVPKISIGTGLGHTSRRQQYVAPRPAPAPVIAEPENPEFPHAGTGFATRDAGLKVWLDPHRSFCHPNRPAVYEVAGHPNVYYIDHLDGRDSAWRKFPVGEYVVYPYGDDDEISVSWGVPK